LKEDDSKEEREDGRFLKAAASDADESSLSPCFATPVEALAAAGGRAKRERKDAVRSVLRFMFAIQCVHMCDLKIQRSV